ncbi:hypothetical protein LCGC14_2889050, partial [marine sediment metagenome]
MKQCRKCKKLLDESCFGIRQVEKDGLHYYCKDCIKIYTGVSKERVKVYNKTYRQVN